MQTSQIEFDAPEIPVRGKQPRVQSVFFLHSHLLPATWERLYGGSAILRGTVWCLELNEDICRRQSLPYSFPVPLMGRCFEKCHWLLTNLDAFLPQTVRVIQQAPDVCDGSSNSVPRVLLALEGADAIGEVAQNIVPLHQKGLRLVQLVHWKDNAFCTLAGGLTRQGRELLQLCGDLGMILDLTHLPEIAWASIEQVWKHPFVVSHAVCEDAFAFSPLKRRQSLSQRQLQALTERGGLVGIPIVSELVAGDDEYSINGLQASLQLLVRQIDYMAEKYGIEYVCLGPDYMDLEYYSSVFGACITYVEGFMGGQGLCELAATLRGLGYTEKHIEMVFFRNVEDFLRRHLCQ